MEEGKAFLVNPMHQYRVSQLGECDLVHIKKNGDCYEYESLFHFTNDKGKIEERTKLLEIIMSI